MSEQNSGAEREILQQQGQVINEPLLVQSSQQKEVRQSQNQAMNAQSVGNNQRPQPLESPSSQQKNSPQQPGNSNDSSPSSDEQQQKSDNIDQNKSDNSEDQQESNVKSDDKDEDQDRSGDDTKKQQPSGKKCFNKLCNSKKIYKKLRSKVEHAKYRFLCRPCYENYCNNDFCEFCEQIYSSTGNADDDDQWIGCDQCNRWNHIECEKKYRNTNIHETKDQDTPYLCLTCTFKFKKDPPNEKKPKNPVNKENYSNVVDDSKIPKQKLQISKEQRIQIFNRKIQNLPSLEYFLQNYNFRLWINENLIKDDLQTLRQAAKRNAEDGKKGMKKVKVD